eukprot:augustus_masked-scaffold_22-processed-gene-3.45-mRNA-1 protein AED:0.19 eAED:0.19 QI:0/-1/0/1/-1/1/1/0/689
MKNGCFSLIQLNRVGLVQRRSFISARDKYEELYAKSISPTERARFWGDIAREKLSWSANFTDDKILNMEQPHFPKWFEDGKLNVCYNCVDRHVEDESKINQTALIHYSQPTGVEKTYTFKEIQNEVTLIASMYEQLGIKKGDFIVIYMPMIPEAVFSMLAAARIGAPHSVVFGGFSPKELATRLIDIEPKLIVTASHGIEPSKVIDYTSIVKEAVHTAAQKVEKNPKIVSFNRDKIFKEPVSTPNFGSLESYDFTKLLEETRSKIEAGEIQEAACVDVPSMHPLYTIYTSGTTGKPKGIVRDSGGSLAVLAYSMESFMKSTEDEDVYLCTSDIGWTVGHAFLVYGPLAIGRTTILYEGKPIKVNFPEEVARIDTEASKSLDKAQSPFWWMVDRYKASQLFTAPTALRAIRKVDPNLDDLSTGGLDITSLRTLFVAGERADPTTVKFFARVLQKPVVDNYWQTETGSPAVGFTYDDIGMKPGSCGLPAPGFDVHVLESKDDSITDTSLGDICFKMPMPPGALTTIYKAPERFVDSYLTKHPGFYFTGDAGLVDDDGYISVMSRTDDVINTAGHRLSSGQMEEIVSAVAGVVECCVIGLKDELKTEVPIAFVVFSGDDVEQDVINRVKDSVKEGIGNIAALKEVYVVPGLPKTRSGKILRATIRKICEGEDYVFPATIEDHSTLEHFSRLV